MRNILCLVFMTGCFSKSLPAVSPPNDISPNDGPMCTPLDTCNASAELTGLIQSLIPQPANGADGKNGTDGVSPSVQSVVDQVLAVLPPPQQGVKGEKGDSGNVGPTGQAGTSVSLTDVVNAVLSLLPAPTPGPTGPQGLAGSVGASGQSNTSVLTATRVFTAAGSCVTPPCDYTGTATVNTQAVFVPPVLNVVYGNQNVGSAYVVFEGVAKCAYVGNNKNGSALALYTFVSCTDTGGNVLTLAPGQPFAFNGGVTVQLGEGASVTSTLQVVAFFQIQ